MVMLGRFFIFAWQPAGVGTALKTVCGGQARTEWPQKMGIRSTGWKLHLSFILCRSIYFNHGMTIIHVKFI